MKWWQYGLLVSLVFAGIFSIFASSLPDGLERVSEDLNFAERALTIFKSPIPDYLFPSIKNKALATSLAGVIGVFIVFLLTYQAAKFLKK
ncbi:MAG: PDGLE domain-containing protein [Candidatus Methanofastidiosia archaeon]